jgi:putative DNA primase/helicase
VGLLEVRNTRREADKDSGHAVGCAGFVDRPATWFDYTTCATASEAFDGVGYVFAADDPFTGVDFDACFDGDRLHPEVGALVLVLDSFTEISPSGTGVKTIVRAAKNGFDRCRTSKTPWGGEFECYDNARFFTITGQLLRGCPATIERRQGELERTLARVFGDQVGGERAPIHDVSARVASTDDETLIARACTARNGEKFARLWSGDTKGYGSDSEADLALAGLLAFWTGPDPARTDSLFRRSQLMRQKWDSRRGQPRTEHTRSTWRSAAAPTSTRHRIRFRHL